MGKLNLTKIMGPVLLLCLGLGISASAQTFTTLANFNYTNGARPNGALVQGTDGNFYGTTVLGGSSSNCTDGCGTAFKVTAAGTLTMVHSFSGADGSAPTGIIQGIDGNFYGTTATGGADNSCAGGCGTIFKLTSSGTLTTLHSFNGTGGSGPYAGLIQGLDGNFYGTTSYGGTNNSCTDGCGTIFKVTAKGALTTLHNFDGTDGSVLNGLVQGSDGNFYGATFYGGTFGAGTVFKITAKGVLTTMHNFEGTEGGDPSSPLIQGVDGNFYGAAYDGGDTTNGTIFKITTKGVLTALVSFDNANGDNPAGVVQGTDGNLYGAAQGGGVAFGTIFQMTTKGALTVLHTFNDDDGSDPQGPPIQATNGTFYGTSNQAGIGGYGTVYSFSMGLGAFVKTNPASGKAGTKVTILGNNLAGATSVTFNGKKATFKASNTYITTTVPTGATTGTVEVVTPSKTLKSNVRFQVR